MKKTLNQLKASRRNLSLMLLAGMIANLKHNIVLRIFMQKRGLVVMMEETIME